MHEGTIREDRLTAVPMLFNVMNLRFGPYHISVADRAALVVPVVDQFLL